MSYQKINIHQPAVGLHIARVESLNKLGDCEELCDVFSYMNLCAQYGSPTAKDSTSSSNGAGRTYSAES